MRLKKLILHGFKSFADRTEFVFDSPITGIVGPNGCGKSNVVDGFKWVLGEQSAKSLRGDAMMDVIFNGSGGRKPAGMAEVVLVFENPRRDDGIRKLNIDTDEVSVGRRLFRDGTSEYQLNNSATRLKDVRELFLDTGVGVDAYSVIEQGRVAALLEANPAERRLIFEEAAGISKYKAKKKEAQRKLERVDQNLLRVQDIVEEVEKRLRSVKVQAGRARTYQEHSDRLRELRLTYALQEYHTLHSQQGELESSQSEAERQLAELTSELEGRQIALASQRQDFDALSQQKQRGDYELVQTRAAIQSSRQQQQFAAQQLQQAVEQLAQFEQDRVALANKSEETAASLAHESADLERLSSELSEHRRQIEQLQQAFHDGQLELNNSNREIEQHKAAILDLMRQASNVSNRIGAIEIERKNIAAQQSRLTDRRTAVIAEIEGLDQTRSELDSSLHAVVAEQADLQSQLDTSTGVAAAVGKQIKEVSEQLGAAREHRSGLQSRQKLLQDLEARREGVSEGVKSVLRQRNERFPFVRGLVADILRVDVEHAAVVEAALDGKDQFLVTSDPAAAIAAEQAFLDLEGRINVINGNGYQPVQPEICALDYDWNQHQEGVRLAIDLVRFEYEDEPLAMHLLGRTVVTDTLADAVALSKAVRLPFRYVTLQAEVLEADGTLRVGPLTAAMGLLSRRSELEAIAMQLHEVDRRIEQLSAMLSEGNTQAKDIQEKQNTLRNALYQSNTGKVQLTSRIAQNQDKQNALSREVITLDRELANLSVQIGRLEPEEQTLIEKRNVIEADQADRQQQVIDLSARQAELSENLKKTGEELTTTRVLLGQIQEKQLAAQQAVRRLEASRAEIAQQLERVIRSAESTSARQADLEVEAEKAREAEVLLVEKQDALAAQVAQLTEQVTALQKSVEILAAAVEEIGQQHGERAETVHKLQLQTGELRVRLEGLVQRTLDELQLDVPARYTQLADEGGYQPADADWDAVAGEIKELKERIQRLGNVNLDAINEQAELEERSTFLSTQVNDLVDSKRQLEELIDTINKESGLRFEQTFNAVREHFQGMFRKLFGGGKADIYLETSVDDVVDQEPIIGPDGQRILPAMKKTIDPLDAGIDIIAHPPGKKPVSISQLSGGEKTMTCVALLMSIFKSKPSPFCILDEVDAALDEANNQRFNLIVQEFLEQSQFIIITHSKRSMQIADVLYGVTMQEQGVSKRVAVRFDQVDNQGRISETAAA